MHIANMSYGISHVLDVFISYVTTPSYATDPANFFESIILKVTYTYDLKVTSCGLPDALIKSYQRNQMKER